MDFLLAIRYLRCSPKGFISLMSLLSFIGILLGVATLIITLSVMNGFRSTLTDKILSFNSHMSIHKSSGKSISFPKELLLKLDQIPTITKAIPLINEKGMLSYKSKLSAVMIKGMHKKDMMDHLSLNQKIIHNNIEHQKTIVIGKELAQKLDVRLGNHLSLMTIGGKRTPFGVMPRSVSFVVAAIFDAGMNTYNDSFVYIPLKDAQKIFNLHNQINTIDLYFKSLTTMKSNLDSISHLLKHYDLKGLDWQKRNAPLFSALLIQRNVMFLILTLIIVIATFNIVSGLVMMVRDKTSSIGILRAMGLERFRIMKIFVYIGSILGVSGTLCGGIIGVFICHNMDIVQKGIEKILGTNLFSAELYYLSQLPVKMSIHDIFTVCSTSIGITFISTIYPALRGAKLCPIQALRHE